MLPSQAPLAIALRSTVTFPHRLLLPHPLPHPLLLLLPHPLPLPLPPQRRQLSLKIPSSARIGLYGVLQPMVRPGEPMPTLSPTLQSLATQDKSPAAGPARPATMPCWDQAQQML